MTVQHQEADRRRVARSSQRVKLDSSDSLFARLRASVDENAREELLRRYLPLARRLASRYSRSSEPLDDLIQVASFAVLKAIDRFDPERGISFLSFATPTVTGELKRHFRDHTWAVHVPRGSQELAMAVDDAREALTEALGRAPSVQQIASHLNVSAEQVLDALQVSQAYSAVSLDAPRPSGEDGEEVAQTLEPSIGVLDERFELAEDRATLAGAIRTLPPRDRRVLRLRFLEEKVQREIALELGISQMQVSRLLGHSLANLRIALGRTGAR